MAGNFHATLMAQYLLEARNISCLFGEFQAVKPLDLHLSAGEIVTLVGPNGSGKTTLLYCLSGLLRPTTGNVLIGGHDLYRDEVIARRLLAFIPDVPRFYQELTTWEHLYFISLAFGIEQGWEDRANSILSDLGMWQTRGLYPHNLSRGMRLKLGIALALLRPFQVLLMDEPTSALDPDSVDLFLDKLLALRDSGKAILLTSHDLRLVERLGGKTWQMEQGGLRTD
jgi:ABC-2 type transport system ATP-binding protein